MAEVTLNLVVLKVSDLEVSARFYEALGLSFQREQHGSGPEHLSANAGVVLLELYPLNKGEIAEAMRIGFVVASLEAVLDAVVKVGGKVSQPRSGPWGQRAVAVDPDGHKVEPVQAT
jgi:predicted enzyme related to lactoylglutathione lyase